MICRGLIDLGISQDLQDVIVADEKECVHSCALYHGDSVIWGGVYASKLIVKPANLALL